MGIIEIIMLLIRVLFTLPSIIGVVREIIGLIHQFKGADFWEILSIVGEILRLILTLSPSDKEAAKQTVYELRDTLKAEVKKGPRTTGYGDAERADLKARLVDMRDNVKKKCEGVGCPSDTKML